MPSEKAPTSIEHRPYIPDDVTMPEFTWSAVLIGAVLGIIFGASSLYLVLKVGMTVSASIPVAVLSITLFRWLGNTFGIRRATILENNIVQTTGSAGESIAFGVGVTMPTMLLIGFDMEWSRVLVVSVLGGLLGILMMIPLRRAFIVNMHGRPGQPGTLLYPEGTACAKVLESGESGGASGNTVFIGFGLAFVHKFLTEGVNLLTETVGVPLKFGAHATDAFSRVARLSTEMASELLGVGYIIGVRTSSVMMAGAVLGGLVITPTLALSSDTANMSTKDLYEIYLRAIGAGCVAAAGIISMGRTLPMILKSFTSGLKSMRGAGGTAGQRRTEDDMSMTVVFGGSLILLAALAAFLMKEVGVTYAILGSILVLLFGFLFVTVSSRLTGEIGSSSNPISGMTVATLLMTCLIFLGLGMTDPMHAVLALSIGGVVCIAASNGGTTSQDLKTGFLIGATPRLQQWAILIGAITSAVVIGGTLLLFNSVGTVYSQRNLPAIDLKDRVGSFTEKMTYDGEDFYVWRNNSEESLPSAIDPKLKVDVKPGIFLVDADGHVCYQIDPTITGKIDQRDELKPATEIKAKLAPAEVERLKGIKNTFAVRSKKSAGNPITYYLLWTNDPEHVAEQETKTTEEKRKLEPARSDVAKGLYLVDGNGTIVFVVSGTKVTFKFGAPKTQVMGIIINGLLQGKLNWALVLIGACIAVMLELCGVSSLAFAVGLYIPMQYSTPIFMGGIVRWMVDAYTTRQAKARAMSTAPGDAGAQAEAEVQAIAESETSPGMLLASGLIAGGSLGGMTAAFLEFLPRPIKDPLDLSSLTDSAYKTVFGENLASVMQEVVAMTLFLIIAAVLLLAGIGVLFKGATPPDGTQTPPADRGIRPS